MDQIRIASLTRALRTFPSRRDVLRGLAAAGLGLGAARVSAITEAKKKRKRKKKSKKPKPNAFGCLNVGDACKTEDDCCSGICEGKKGQRTCIGHNAGACKAQFDGCQTLVIGCGTGGFCFRTTGNASFCGGPGGSCMVCAKDADCEPTHGPGAACVVCDDCIGMDGSNGTVCYPAGV